VPTSSGFFVVFEGGEGAGKSTQVKRLAQSLAEQQIPVVITREPGGTVTAEAIREILLAPSELPMSARCEALLFAAARADHVAKVITPALERDEVVICDRFVDSSLAYQGFARSLPVAEVAELSAWATMGLIPDLTIVLDVPPEVGLERARDGNRMEDQELSFHQAVRAGMLTLAQGQPERYLVIDGTQDADVVATAVLAEVMDRRQQS